MANIKISALTAASSFLAADLFMVDEAGATKSVSGTQIYTLVEGSGSAVASLTLTLGVVRRSWQLDVECRSDQASLQSVLMQLNADTGANYDYSELQDANTTLTGLAAGVATANARVGIAIPTGATAGAQAIISIRFLNADSTTQRKGWMYTAAGWSTDAAANAIYEAGQGQWRNTAAAISSIKLFPNAGNFANIRARIYGLP